MLKSILFAIIFFFSFQTFAAESIDVINISGNIRVNDEVIKHYFKDCIGKAYDRNQVNEILKEMYSEGIFEKIDIKVRSNILYVTVKENPFITDIFVEGNKKIDDNVILSEISLKKRGVFSKSKLKNDIKRITDLYKRTGRFLSRVDAEIINDTDNRIRLIFIINEGNKAKIDEISFIGNEKFSDDALKSVIYSKENKFYKLFGSSIVYDPERLEYDKDLLRMHYLSNGYADFEILSAVGEATKNKDKFNIIFLINEGEKYNFGDIRIINNIKKLDTSIVEREIKIKTGDIFNQNLLMSTVDKITVVVAKYGYAFVDVEPRISKDKENRIINVNFILHPARKAYVGDVKITGNTRTIDKVIRKEIRVDEGDPYNNQSINRSVERIRNLGYFSSVDVNRAQGEDPDKIDLAFNVVEQKTGEMNLGLGFSTVDGLNANIAIRERNLLGSGRSLSAGLVVSEYEQQLSASYGKPYFADRDVFVSVNSQYLKQKIKDTIRYARDTYGAGVSASYSISEYIGHKVFYDFSNETIKNVSEEYVGIITPGSETISLIGQTLSYDRRDNRYDPKNGFYLSLGLNYAGLGGSKTYLSARVNATAYKQILFEDVVFKVNFNAGIIDGLSKALSPTDGFYLGGNSMRGFEYGGIGPRIISTSTGRVEDGDSIGGNKFYVGEAEIRFPLGLPKELRIFGSLFINAGTVTGVDKKNNIDMSRIVDSGSIRSAYGFSVVWNSPVGPLSLDFSNTIKKEIYDIDQTFRFNYGSVF